MLSIGPHRDHSPATQLDATKDGWDGFAHDISLAELDLAEVSNLASRRAIWADRFTKPPGHHEYNLLQAVRVAIAHLRECV